jgi:hypothetical protein
MTTDGKQVTIAIRGQQIIMHINDVMKGTQK